MTPSNAEQLDKDVEDMLASAIEDDDIDDVDESLVPASVMDKSAMDLQVAALIPLHQVPGIPAKRRPGRPKKIKPQPTADDLVYHAKMAEQQTRYVDNDSLVRATSARKDPTETLQICKERLARVLAALEFRRIEDEKTGGKDSAQILSREASTLREITQLELRISEMRVQLIDLHGEAMQKVFGMFILKLRAVALGVLPKEQFDLLFNRLDTALDGWEEEAENLLR